MIIPSNSSTAFPIASTVIFCSVDNTNNLRPCSPPIDIILATPLSVHPGCFFNLLKPGLCKGNEYS